MKQLTQARLKELLHYDPETGVFTWRVDKGNKIKKGGKAGCIEGNGYRIIGIDGKVYKASRLAFLYMEGYFPENDVDHKNQIRNDDRWKNLRHVSRQCNIRNSKLRKDSFNKVTGVGFHIYSGKFQAYIKVNKKQIYLGTYDWLEEAVFARWKAEVKYNFPNCNTTSSAYCYLKENKLL